MIQGNSTQWTKFGEHMLQFEGKLSKNPNDTASKCVQPGQYHTNRGVTYCTFKAYAEKLGVTPVTYQRFVNMDDNDAIKFLYLYYLDIKGDKLPDSVGLALTNASWGSGPARAKTELIMSLKKFGINAKNYDEAVEKSFSVPEKDLFNELVRIRENYFVNLGSSTQYASFLKGWLKRLDNFIEGFAPSKKKMILLPLAIFLIIFLIINKIKK